MIYLNRELQTKLNELTPRNKSMLEQFLLEIGSAKRSSEKQDAVMKLRSQIREIVAEEEQT